MKKFLIITAVTIALILALLIALPLIFQDKIIEKVKVAINENVNARVDFGDFRLSLIRNFPDVSVRMNDLSVVGVDNFEGDTLAGIQRFFISIDVMSLFGSEGYKIESITIDNPRVLLKVLEDGTVNWDIMKETAEEDTAAVDDSGFKLALKHFEINNGYLVYDDRELNLVTELVNLNNTLRGDMTDDFTTLKIRDTSIEQWYLLFDGVRYFNGTFVDFTADIDADLNAFEFTFRENTLQVNDLTMAFEGTFAMPEDDMIMDFTFSSPKTDFKSILSLVPAIYAKDFEGLKTSGTLALTGHLKGTYNDELIPGFGLNLKVENGMFQYPDLPAAITDVNVVTTIDNPGGDVDYTVVDVSRFNLNMAGNPVTLRMNLKTPVSDPQIDATLNGKIDLGRVKDFYPLEEGETLAGIIQSDMTARGRMSSIENEQYQDFVFTGNMVIDGLNYVSSDFPQGVQISEASMDFSPQFARLQSFMFKMGESDISATGRIDNILGYALNDQVLSGQFQTTSNLFDLNQLMAEDPEAEEDTTSLSVIEVPENIDFNLQSRFNRILFDDLVITNATGNLKVANQTVSMNNVNMEMLGGTMVLNGSYATQDVTRPEINFGLDIKEFDLKQTFNTFNTFKMLAPIGEKATGKFSAGFDLRSLLDQGLNPILPTLAGGGVFRSKAINIENSKALTGLAERLNMDMFKNMNLRDVNISFEFNDGRVDVKPFDVNFGQSKATISGNHGFDQSINYLLSMAIPRAQFGGAANQALDNLLSQASSRGLNINPEQTVNIGVAFTGTVTNPKINLSLAQTGEDARQQVISTVKEAVKDATESVRQEVDKAVDDTKEKATEELERRARQVIEEAERQAENIRQEAKNSADAVRQEAREQARKLEDEASGTLAKMAARRTGEELVRTADNNALKIEREANQQATNIVDQAKERADKIRAGEE